MPYANLADKIRRQRERRVDMPPERKAICKKQNAAGMRAFRASSFKKSRDGVFVGVDSEGGGKDALGRQNCLLIRAGEHLLFNDNKPLTTDDCLGFLTGLPPEFIYVAYYFDYDVTMILKDTTYNQRERILKPRIEVTDNGIEVTRITWVGDYLIEYLPRKYFKVKHKDQKHWIEINEVGPFFQTSFLSAITTWNIGSEEQRETIKAGKLARKDFELMNPKEIEYNRLECHFLSDLMHSFREMCIDTDIMPQRWQGPGFLATAMMRQHNIPKRKDIYLPQEIWPYANGAYYGGRSELFKPGSVKNVIENDINSAYPYAMLSLPCLQHGHWEFAKGKPPQDALYVADVQFINGNITVCNLPIRHDKLGHIYWPKRGSGVYWSTELNAAQRAYTKITHWESHWRYHKECDCVPFSWLDQVYAKRKEYAKEAKAKGVPLKLAINSLYGKTAQSIGAAPYANPVWAGLITAHTRSMLIDAYNTINETSVVMLATDGLYTTEPVDLPHGEWLGEWETKLHDEIFFVQPGVYFYGSDHTRPKTRGVPMAELMKNEQQFRDIFAEWNKDDMTLFGEPETFPHVSIDLHCFIGMKLAQLWHKPDYAGQWQDRPREISFDFRNKRSFVGFENGHINTIARPSKIETRSAPYRRDIGRWREQEELDNALFHAQPDLFILTPQDARQDAPA